MYQSERAHLARLSHQMPSANVAERRVVIVEQQLDFIEAAVTGAVAELFGRDVDSEQVRGTGTSPAGRR